MSSRRSGNCIGRIAWLAAALIAMIPVSASTGDPGADLFAVDDSPTPGSMFTAVASAALPSVVSIRTVRSVTHGDLDLDPMEQMYRRYFPGGERGDPFARPGSGTGFVATRDGHVITNHHVIARADAVKVRLSGEKRDRPATVVGVDPASDLAVLRIEAGVDSPALVFADSDSVKVGDWAIAVGNPFGNLEGSLTVGVVSAKERSDLVIAGGGPSYQDFLQTDAPINFGNSGGPLLDISGRVIGVNTAVKAGGQGIGFAIPSNLVRRVCSQLIADGRVVRGYLGARFVDAEGGGAVLLGVLPGAPAEAAGLREDDVIVSLDGHGIRRERDLRFAVAAARVGVPVPCSFLRGGERSTVEVVLSEAGAPGAAAWRGLTVADAAGEDPRAEALRESLGIEPLAGALVVAVEPGSAAARSGMNVGDVVLDAMGRSVSGAEQFREIVGGSAAGDQTVRLLVEYGGERRYVDVGPGDPGRVR